MEQAEIKERISQIIEKYEVAKKSNLISKYTEEETKKDFILPLFKVLGWDVDNKNEVTAEEHQSSGRVDYGFYSNGRLKFYLEAKALGANLHKEEFATQAVRYSWNKGATWAILTDFESIKVFNAQDIERSLADKIFFEIPYTQYLERFDQLWLLSKSSFEENSLDKEAEKVGKKFQKVAVSTLLYKDLDKCREILTHDLAQWNTNIDKDLLDEGVQKLLDRLIFLRVAEDRNIEAPTLIPLIRDWENNGRKSRLYESMIQKFRELDPIYDSGLFSEHPFEKWEEYSGATEKVINILYGKKGYYEYDFKAMPADVLGGVYENYLGYRLLKSKKGISLGKDAKKRKEHGIYYTPSFIVDYIVENTLKLVLDKCTSIEDLKKIKVLDPACGSGSFLIKALETIYDKYLEFGNTGGVFTKIDIILNNIYGVDLDPQAVEIARLNLLINALDRRMTLPNLNKNIKNGNSLISGTDEELTKYFGKNYRDKKPFNWQEEFPEVFKQGGFDVIIGNPPYGAELSSDDQKYFREIYRIGSTDTAILFIKKTKDILKQDGEIGFIIPKAFSFASNYKVIRDYVWNNLKVLIDCGKVWNEVKLEQIIFIMNNGFESTTYQTGILKNGIISIIGDIEKETSKKFGFLLNGVSEKEILLAKKILCNSIVLNDIVSNQRGAMLQKYISDIGELNVIGGAQLTRFGVLGNKGKISKNLVNDIKAFSSKDSILVQRIIAHIENPIDHIKITATMSNSSEYILVDTINQLKIKNRNFHPIFICSLLNSKLLNWYCYRFIFAKAIRTMQFDNPTTSRIPVPRTNLENQEIFISLSKKNNGLFKEQKETETNSEKWKSIKLEIERTDKKIDEEVYKLYGLTEEEIKIVEKSV